MFLICLIMCASSGSSRNIPKSLYLCITKNCFSKRGMVWFELNDFLTIWNLCKKLFNIKKTNHVCYLWLVIIWKTRKLKHCVWCTQWCVCDAHSEVCVMHIVKCVWYAQWSVWYTQWSVCDTHSEVFVIHTVKCVWCTQWSVCDTHSEVCVIHTVKCVWYAQWSVCDTHSEVFGISILI